MQSLSAKGWGEGLVRETRIIANWVKNMQKTIPKYNMERSPDNKHQAIPIGRKGLKFWNNIKINNL